MRTGPRALLFLLFAALAMLSATACSRKERAPEADSAAPADVTSPPAIAPHSIARPQQAVAELAILTNAPREVLDALVKDRAKHIADSACGDAPTCAAVRAFARDDEHVTVRIEKTTEWGGIPHGEALDLVAQALSKEERDAVPSLPFALVVHAHGEALPNQLPARSAFAITATLAERLHARPRGIALVYDETLRHFEPARAFASHVITTPLGDNVLRDDRFVIQLYRQDDGTARLLTLGMHRFGAADVEIEGASVDAGPALGRVLNAIAARLASGETKAPLRVCAKDACEVGFEASPHHEGDPDNTFLRVVARGGEAGGGSAKAYDVLARAFASPDDAVQAPDESTRAALRAATERARGAFGSAVARSHVEGASLAAKLPFEAPDHHVEEMWIDVTHVDDVTLDGTLASVPATIPDLHAGAPVHAKRADLLDYILTLPDGGTEGGETARILSAPRAD